MELPDNIRESDNRNLFKKQIYEILINILKKENAYTSHLLLFLKQLKACEYVTIL